jgi:CRP-like cAMP-binding protein
MSMSTINSDTIKSFLSSVQVYSKLSDRALSSIASSSDIRRIPRGYVLFSQSAIANAVYVVRSGCIALILTTSDGKELVINEMREGDCFGELSLLTDQSRSTGAMAREDTHVISIPRDAFLRELTAEPNFMRGILETTAQRLRVSSERESALAFLDAPTRLAKVLLKLDKEGGSKGIIRISQDELGRRVGLTRQTVAKNLGHWRRSGIIRTGRRRIELMKPDEIQALAVGDN